MMNGATGIWPKRGYVARWRIPGYQVLQDPLGMRRLIDSAVDSCLQQFLPSPPTPLPQQAGGEGSQIEQTGRLPVFAGHHERQYVGSVLRVHPNRSLLQHQTIAVQAEIETTLATVIQLADQVRAQSGDGFCCAARAGRPGRSGRRSPSRHV